MNAAQWQAHFSYEAQCSAEFETQDTFNSLTILG